MSSDQTTVPTPMVSEEVGLGVMYVCGDCGHQNTIKPKEPVRCRRCGYRILYKMRTKRLIQFEAR